VSICFCQWAQAWSRHPGPSASPATRLVSLSHPLLLIDFSCCCRCSSRSVALQTPAVKYFGSSVTASLLFQFMPQGYPLCHHLIGSNDVFDLGSRYSGCWKQVEIFSNKACRSIMSDLLSLTGLLLVVHRKD